MGPREVGGCLEELRAVTTALDQQVFIGRPKFGRVERRMSPSSSKPHRAW